MMAHMESASGARSQLMTLSDEMGEGRLTSESAEGEKVAVVQTTSEGNYQYTQIAWQTHSDERRRLLGHTECLTAVH
ncbi:hypothetical protein GN244_ATG19639 [Phytophthora infestans]|uniref:Uncharacterized protein n=1 Tax=Phytophthora infestans TaxID=4787 RepID=A0A833SIT8_PHYIN|nr:hypothetical protein GN244_ATG19639 [Phytophthora infestans]